jgi:hypothetical protein
MKRMVRKLLILMIIGAVGAAVLRTRRRSHAVPDAPLTEWPPFETRSDGSHNGAVSTESAASSVVNAGAVKTGAIGAMAAEAEESHVEPSHAEPSHAEQAHADWVAPVDGNCPDGYPIKANDNSHIFHVPGGRFYDRTVAERCYATTEAAVRDGYRQAKA